MILMKYLISILMTVSLSACVLTQKQDPAVPSLPPPPPEAPEQKVNEESLTMPQGSSPAPDPLANQKLGMSVVKRNCQKNLTKVTEGTVYNEVCDTEIFVRLRFICLDQNNKPVPHLLIESDATRYMAKLSSNQKGSGETFKLTGFKAVKNSLLEISIPNPNHPKLQLQELSINLGNQKHVLNPGQLSQAVYLEAKECTNLLPETSSTSQQ